MKAYNKNFLGFIFQDPHAGCRYLHPLSYTHQIGAPQELTCCPLCGDRHYVQVGAFQIDALIDGWVTRCGFNPIADVYRHKILEKRRCQTCDLSYYNYHLPDAPELYQHLASTGQYYPSFRPEYGIVTEMIEKDRPKSLMEIGCGDGAFLTRIQHLVPHVMGSEYNPHAAQICTSHGLNVVCDDIQQIQERFDVVCHFEVLEHVSDTHAFMNNTVRLVRPGGRLIISTPDPDGILSINGNGVLNLPPHHQFDFSKRTFEYLAQVYHLKISAYQKTELTYYHYAMFVQNITGMALTQPDIAGFFAAQKKYTDHSHVVVFEK